MVAILIMDAFGDGDGGQRSTPDPEIDRLLDVLGRADKLVRLVDGSSGLLTNLGAKTEPLRSELRSAVCMAKGRRYSEPAIHGILAAARFAEAQLVKAEINYGLWGLRRTMVWTYWKSVQICIEKAIEHLKMAIWLLADDGPDDPDSPTDSLRRLVKLLEETRDEWATEAGQWGYRFRHACHLVRVILRAWRMILASTLNSLESHCSPTYCTHTEARQASCQLAFGRLLRVLGLGSSSFLAAVDCDVMLLVHQRESTCDLFLERGNTSRGRTRRSADTTACFEMLEPRLLLSRSTIHLREVAGTACTVTDFDDCHIQSDNDTVFNSYFVTVRSGTGDGTDYHYSQVVDIAADSAPSGEVFYRWAGDADGVADVYDPTTTITMPNHDTIITATYILDYSQTIHLREESGTGYTATNFDDTYIQGDSDDSFGTAYKALMQNGSGSLYYATLIGVADLFTLLPKTDGNGGVIDITKAYLNVSNYEGSASDTVYINRMTTNWLADTAGDNENDVSFEHADKSAEATWASGDFSSGDYTATNQVTYTWSDTFRGEKTIDITGIVEDMYNNELNYGFALRTDATSSTVEVCTSEITGSGWPSLEIAYAYEYTPTVTSGTGDGTYHYQDTPGITADSPATGYEFDVWTGDTAYVTDVNASSTTVTMPTANVSVTATYSQIDYKLTVNSGTGDGTYHYQDTRGITGDAPATGYEFNVWTGDTAYVTDVNDPTTTVTMPAANVTVTATYVLTDYTLTVTDGTGDGTYHYQDTPTITADTAPTGKEFDQWTGDTAGVDDVNDPTTTYTMPNASATVTATYEWIDRTLVVNTGTGDGVYEELDVVDIVANTPATGRQFDEWTSDTHTKQQLLRIVDSYFQMMRVTQTCARALGVTMWVYPSRHAKRLWCRHMMTKRQRPQHLGWEKFRLLKTHRAQYDTGQTSEQTMRDAYAELVLIWRSSMVERVLGKDAAKGSPWVTMSRSSRDGYVGHGRTMVLSVSSLNHDRKRRERTRNSRYQPTRWNTRLCSLAQGYLNDSASSYGRKYRIPEPRAEEELCQSLN